MRRRLAALVLVAAPFAGIVATAPAAQACTGIVCDTICDVWNSKPGQVVFGTPCPIR